uniref:CSON012486 protein n=1 Tax=Culicoides sonorensis TaxID=179676 RepID=A0A336M5N5_CULSO
MLNCTDLACVLHHHHFYAHLHHLKHHLSDDHHDSVDYHHETQSEAPPTGYHVESNDEASIQSLLNDTESDLSQLSHLDAPNDVIYMVCGVVIAMLLVGLIIVLVAVTISKLRKREDSSAGSPVHVESPQAVLPNESTPPVTYRQQPPSNWVFPPLPPQPNLYIHNAANHKKKG